jgi:hypothetical protein
MNHDVGSSGVDGSTDGVFIADIKLAVTRLEDKPSGRVGGANDSAAKVTPTSRYE